MTRLLPLLLLVACAHRGGLRDRLEQGALLDAATTYWTAVRWNDAATASTFASTLEGRAAVARAVSAPALRLTEAKVVQAAVDTPEEGPRRGVVVVQLEGYPPAGVKLTVTAVEQYWVRAGGGWRIDEARSMPTDGEAW